jgi:purine-binding chemotaxis protein CheW
MNQTLATALTNHLDGSVGSIESQQLVTFLVGEQLYCVDIMSVREIRVCTTLTPLPGEPDYVRGMINLRGTVVPVLDLRTRFGEGRGKREGAVVIVIINGRLQGLLVDQVCDIVTVPAGGIAPIPETDTSRRHPFFQGLITQGDALLIVIALDRLM